MTATIAQREFDDLQKEIAGDPRAALDQLRMFLTGNPEHPGAIALVGRILQREGRADWRERASRAGEVIHGPLLAEGLAELRAGRNGEARDIFNRALAQDPRQPAVLRLVAAALRGLEDEAGAESALRAALTMAPGYRSASLDLARLLHANNRLAEALEALAPLDPCKDDAQAASLRYALLARMGQADAALAAADERLRHAPNDGAWHIRRGDALRSLGRTDEAVEAYHTAKRDPATEVRGWWCLSNIKTYRFDPAQRSAMLTLLARLDAADETMAELLFALSRAFEDAGDPAAAFGNLCVANRIISRARGHDPSWVSQHVSLCADLAGHSPPPPAIGKGPLFIVGMPRSGSTLIEQILASHSAIEGLGELPYILEIGRELERGQGGYSVALERLTADDLDMLAERCLRRMRAHAAESGAILCDKNPNNWLFLDLVVRLFPDARIIDIRRDPLDCGLANFRHHFTQGQGFAYSLDHFGRFYRDYERFMTAFERRNPGRVHRVGYEKLVRASDAHIADMLGFLGLPAEPGCFAAHETRRVIRTPSAEQVREPITDNGVGSAQPFRAWLGPLVDALGQSEDSIA